MKSKGGDQTDSVSKTESVFEAGLPTKNFGSKDDEALILGGLFVKA